MNVALASIDNWAWASIGDWARAGIDDRSWAAGVHPVGVERDGSVAGERATLERGARRERDARQRYDGPHELRIGAEGCGAADLPIDVARVAAVDRANRRVASSDQRAAERRYPPESRLHSPAPEETP
jgi:hypothetical protein